MHRNPTDIRLCIIVAALADGLITSCVNIQNHLKMSWSCFSLHIAPMHKQHGHQMVAIDHGFNHIFFSFP